MRRSNAEDFRARSAYKLLEVQKKYKLLKEGMVVVDCGAAPGAWTRGLYYSLLEYNHTYKKLLYFIKNSSSL